MAETAIGSSEAAPIEVISSDSEELPPDAQYALVTGVSREVAQQALAAVDRRIRNPEARLQKAIDRFFAASDAKTKQGKMKSDASNAKPQSNDVPASKKPVLKGEKVACSEKSASATPRETTSESGGEEAKDANQIELRPKPKSNVNRPSPKSSGPNARKGGPLAKRQLTSKTKKPFPKAKAQRKRGRKGSSDSDSECESESTHESESESPEEDKTPRGRKGPGRAIAVKPKGKGKADPARRRLLAVHPMGDDEAIADALQLTSSPSKKSQPKSAVERKKKPTPAKGVIQRKRDRISSSEEERSSSNGADDESTHENSTSDSESDTEPRRPIRRGKAKNTESVEHPFIVLKPSGTAPDKTIPQVNPGVAILPKGLHDQAVAAAIVEDVYNYNVLLQQLDRGQHSKTESLHQKEFETPMRIEIPRTEFRCLVPILIALQGFEEQPTISIGDLVSLLYQCCPHCCGNVPLTDMYPPSPLTHLELHRWFVANSDHRDSTSALEYRSFGSIWASYRTKLEVCPASHKAVFDMMLLTLGDLGPRPFSLKASVTYDGEVPVLQGVLEMKRNFRPVIASAGELRVLRKQFEVVMKSLAVKLTDCAESEELNWARSGDFKLKDTEFLRLWPSHSRLAEVPIEEVLNATAVAVPEDLTQLPTVSIPEGISVTPKPHQLQNLAWMLEREQRGVKDYLRLTVEAFVTPHLQSPCKTNVVVLWNPLTMQYTSFPESTFASDPELEDWLNPTIRGGLLCDEMGLGKTLSMTMLIKAHPAPDVIPQPKHDVKRDANGLTEVKFSEGTRFSFKNQDHVGALPPWAGPVVQQQNSFQLEKLKATLIVVPVSLFGQWIDELRKMWGQSPLTVLPFHGPERNKFTAEDFRKADVILTTYETLRNSYPSLEQRLKSFFRRGWEHRQRVLSTQDRSLLQDIVTSMAASGNFSSSNQASLGFMTTSFFEMIPDSALSRFQFHRVIWDECQKLTDQIPFVSADHQWLVSGTPIAGRHDVSSVAARLGITAYCTPSNRLRGNSNVNIFLPQWEQPNENPLGTFAHMSSSVLQHGDLSWRMMLLFVDLLLSFHSVGESWGSTQRGLLAAISADPFVVWDARTVLLERETPERQAELTTTYRSAMDRLFSRNRFYLERHTGKFDPSPLIAQFSCDMDSFANRRMEEIRVRTKKSYPRQTILNTQPLLSFFAKHMIRHLKIDLQDSIVLPEQTTLVHQYRPTLDEERAYAFLLRRMQGEFQRLRRAGEEQLRRHRTSKLLGWANTLRRCAAHSSLVSAIPIAPPSGGPNDEENGRYEISSMPPPDVLKRVQSLCAQGNRLPEAVQQIIESICGDPPVIPECQVCLDQMQRPVMLPCHHVVCRECLFAVLGAQADARCPFCRKPLRGPKIQITMRELNAEVGGVADEWDQLVQRAGSGSKLAATMGILEQIWASDSQQKVVIFSSFTECLGQVAEALKANGVASFTIDGSTTLQKRSRLISDFQNPGSATKVCLITSRCGNAGLTLTAANHLLLLEPSLSAHVEQQAAARIHRFGQLKPVTIHRLVATGTIEESIWRLNHGTGVGPEHRGSILDVLERTLLNL